MKLVLKGMPDLRCGLVIAAWGVHTSPIEVWTEELFSRGRVELEYFVVMDVQTIERASNRLLPKHNFSQVRVQIDKRLRAS